jgi:hypothetical protein
MNINNVWSFYVPIIAFIGIAFALADQYWLRRNRMIRRQERGSPTTEPDIDVGGELTTAAKYAIWNYMFSIFAVGGAVIGILVGLASGFAGYMIKDLASKSAVHAALIEIQKPLAIQSDKFATANAALKGATDRVKDEKTFPKLVGDALFADHRQELRGDPGPKGADGKNGVDGKDGKPGADAVTPSIDAIAEALYRKYGDQLRGKNGLDGKNGIDGKPGADAMNPSMAAIGEELFRKYGDQLRGKNGVDGKNGMDGKPGADGPSVTAVADELFKKFSAQLRGKDGSNGKDGINGKDGAPGKDAVNPAIAVVVAELASKYRAALRGEAGAPGKDGKDGAPGKNGPSAAEVAATLMESSAAKLHGAPGKDGKDGVSPEPGKIAELVASQYREQLRGPGGKDGSNGKDGVNGKDGQSPKATDIAAAMWETHRQEILQSLKPRRKPRSR